MPVASFPPPKDIFDDDDEGWQDMPIIREDTSASGLDEEDQKKYHYQASSTTSKTAANATGNLIDVDDLGNEWRSKVDLNESEYTRLRVNEEDDADEVHLRTRYLFDEDKAMTPLSQMQATKNLLTEAQRIAYVGLCSLTSREMVQSLKVVHRKELKPAIANMELWALKIMGRLYYHMELESQEQKMIESLAVHGVLPSDLVPALMTTHTVANPEYDPEEARRANEEALNHPPPAYPGQDDEDYQSISDQTLVDQPLASPHPDAESKTPTLASSPDPTHSKAGETDPASPHDDTHITQTRTTAKILKEPSTAPMEGVTTSLSSTDMNVTLDIRWTVLCDLFLILIADSVYDARSRVLLEQVAYKLGLGWLDVVKFESRITQALEIQENIETLDQKNVVEGVRKAGKKRRYMMLGLATIGGGLVIGLSAGLLAPVIGLGLAGALTTVGVTGTGAFLGGTAGAAVITTGGVLTGSGIAVRGMANRTQQVKTFDILPLHNNKRVNCILTVPGFMNGINDDVRLPFSVLDPIVGDVFSVLWEPEMIRETGSALKILTGEVLSQIGMTVLQATVMTGLMSALQWPLILTKLGYLIDNPWSNALDRAKSAGRVLADVLINRHLGVRPITLIGFSLGARVIFYALLELASQKQFGIVQDVFLLGATLTASQKSWCETRSVVSGRYVNAFARNDWVLNYLFRASSGTVGSVAGLRPIENVPGLENVDVTDKIAGHMSYRTFLPLILDQLGFPVFADYFDEPEEPDFDEERIVVKEEDANKKSGWFSRKKNAMPDRPVSRPPSTSTFAGNKKAQSKLNDSSTKESSPDDDDLPPRMDASTAAQTHSDGTPKSTTVTLPGSDSALNTPTHSRPSTPSQDPSASSSSPSSKIPARAGFDLNAIKSVLQEVENDSSKAAVQPPPAKSLLTRLAPPPIAPPSTRSQSTPPTQVLETPSHPRSSSLDYEYGSSPVEDKSTSSYPAQDTFTSSYSTKPFSASSPRLDVSGFSAFASTSTGSSSMERTPTTMESPYSYFPAETYMAAAARRTDPLATFTANRTNNNPLSFPEHDDIMPSWDAGPPTARPIPASSSSSFSTSSYHDTSFDGTRRYHNNPFSAAAVASANANAKAPAPVLSFGGEDGTITGSSSANGQEDAWSIPPLGGGSSKKTVLDGFSSNPWS